MATRWGLLGAGLITQDFVICLNALPKKEHQVVAIASSRLEAAKKFAGEHEIDKFYGSYEELAKDPNVEVAYVGLVNNQHLGVVKMLLEHGKHVVCEKPMGMNAADTREMVAMARSKKLFFMEAIWSRCFPVYERLRKEIANGTLGKVSQVNATFGRYIENVERVADKNLGGGVTQDIGIYTLQLTSMVFGGRKPQKIVAAGHLNEQGVEVGAGVVLVYDNGQLACLNFSGKHTATSEAVIIGTKGEARLSDPFWSSTTLTLPNKEVYHVKLPEVAKPMVYGNSEGLTYEAQEVRRCIKAGLLECPHITLDESILLADIMEEIKRQLRGTTA